MKSGALKKVAQAYAAYLPAPWQRVGNEFMRRDGDWVQIVAFNASRFSEQYVPRSCMEFLKMPGVPTGGFLVQELQNSNGTQWWVRTSDTPANVFDQMAEQFKPSLCTPLSVSEIKSLLGATMNYWPHAYALCVMACEEGNATDAERYFNAFISATSDKPYPWVETRKQELTECLKLAASPEALRMRLASVRAEKLRALKLKP
jgi:hypothetical protein